MNALQSDLILAAVERAKGLGTIPRDQVVAVVAQALRISEALVRQAIEQEEANACAA
ncbi:hypothetical protein [Roseateles sp.]|jgi:hypothetical protein|uniref:hypothetical protein n=1 Tax=Roseateles sp. TaxID=1971397 RepID=UPI003BA6C133